MSRFLPSRVQPERIGASGRSREISLDSGSDELDLPPAQPSPGGHSSPSTFRPTTVTRNTGEGAALPTSTEGNFLVPVATKKERWYVSWSRKLADNYWFLGLTTVLTIWALTGDDMRIICTEKPADTYFDVVVIACFFIFLLEICVSCLGKDDYTCSFFFNLDVIATASLLLDITSVSDGSIFSDSQEEDNASNLRGGRTAKIGAKFARVVRVLRLVRILKLYKLYFDSVMEARRRKALQKDKEARGPGELDDWEEEDEQVQGKAGGKAGKNESRIGKKLSEMTIRRTICLILAMLLVLPILVHEETNQAPFGADYGANHVWRSFQAFVNSASKRTSYEEALLQYIHYHNWFAKESKSYEAGDSSAERYYAHLYWVGTRGHDAAQVESKAASASVRPATVDAWYAQKTNSGIFTYGSMPHEAKEILGSEWTRQCDSGKWSRRGISLLSTEVEDAVSHTVECPDDLRYQESEQYTPLTLTESQYDEFHLVFYFDLRPFVRQQSVLGLLTTLFVLVLLLLGSLLFSHDANRLVVHPVEDMIDRVKAIRKNPMIAMKMSDEEFKAEELAKARERRKGKEKLKTLVQDLASCRCLNTASELLETVILEKTIIKLGSLLVLGFGEAGANIISHNMKGGDRAGVEAMLPGTQVECIIGVARVQDFSVATEVLQSKIMAFVNQIAEIVHGVANEFHGAPNRNSGDTFLVVWRMDEDRDLRSRYAEMSVVACAKMLAALHRSELLADYRRHPGLQFRLGHNCRVNMTFGLHAGWAIEGAVGSEYKIDASYLSPNVSIAQSVEKMTHIYGVSLIVAQSVVEYCSKAMRVKCRRIDRVIITGSQVPMELYCVDLDYRSVSVIKEEPLTMKWNPRCRYKARQFLESEKSSKLAFDFDLAAAFDADEAINKMRLRYTMEFFQLFNMGYQNYSQGEWQVARRMLSQTEKLSGVRDGPSSALLRYMEDPYVFDAPKDWKGVREIDKL